MRKVKLDPESLRVQSFDALAGPGAERGTVRGHTDTWKEQHTCAFSCIESGDVECDATVCSPACFG